MKEKAIFYARVSTEEEMQVNALAKQVEECRDAISANNWECVDEYIDEGQSGTTTNRNEYQRLLSDLTTDKFDIIVIKSQDRLNRNSTDWGNFERQLYLNGKKLYLYLDNRFYDFNDDKFLAGIKAMLAEEYSRDLSKKINNSNRRRQQSGSSIITNGKLYGYNQFKGQLTINDEESKMVKRIFQLYINGNGCRKIQQQLFKEGYTTPKGTMLSNTTIRRIVTNPNYIGTFIFNKKHKDFISKKVIENPKNEWIIKENIIPAIIDKDTWNKAQQIYNSHIKYSNSENRCDKKAGYNKPNHPLAGKVICGYCGSPFYRRKKTDRRNKNNITYVWQCKQYVLKGKKECDNISISDEYMNKLIEQVATEYQYSLFDVVCQQLDDDQKVEKTSQKKAYTQPQLQDKIDKINAKKSFLLDKYMSGIVSDKDYSAKNNELDKQIDILTDQLTELQEQERQEKENEEYLEKMNKELQDGIAKYGSIEAYSESITMPLKVEMTIQRIKKIIIYKDKIHIDIDATSTEIKVSKRSHCSAA